MKSLIPLISAILLLAALLAGCNSHKEEAQSLQPQIDSLRLLLNKAYKPGMGELMSNIQLHHSKLWFAGENQSWQLAEYNESLIRSAFNKIQLYHGSQPEAKAAFMIFPAMDSLSKAIAEKNKGAFERSYTLMTLTCNNCHMVTSHPFNVITIPKTPPVTDQDFKTAMEQKITNK
jgi:hypothetical protein